MNHQIKPIGITGLATILSLSIAGWALAWVAAWVLCELVRFASTH